MYGNNEWEQWNDKPLQPPDPKKLVPLVTLDDIPSPTPPVVEHVSADEVLCILPVWGHGVLTMRARLDSGHPDTGALSTHGVSLFTDQEIKPVLREKRQC